MKTQKRIGLRFFITYLCIVLPFLAISVVVTSMTMGQMRQDDESQLTARLERVASGLDDQYSLYYESGVYLASMPELSPTAMLSNAVNARRGMNMLQTVYVFDQTIDELLMYYDEEHLYGSNGLARASVYLRSDLGLTAEARAVALALLDAPGQTVACLRRSETTGYIFLHYAMLSGISVNYCIDFSTFANLLQGLAGDEDMLITLTFPYGDALSFGCTNGAFRPLTADAYQSSAARGGWISAAQTTGLMNTRVELQVNERQLYANVTRVQLINYILLALGMLLSGLLSVSLANRRLSQLRNLEAAVSGRPVAETQMGEFGNIHTLIQRTLKENVTALGNFRALLRAQTARLLFHGLLRDPAEYTPLLSKCGLELAEEVYYVAGVFAEGASVEKALEDRLYCPAEAAGRGVYLYLDELPNTDESQQLRKARAQRLSDTLRAAGAQAVVMAISAPVTQLSTIDYAYLSALTELTRQLESGVRDAIDFADDRLALREHALPARELEDFASALSEYNGAKAAKMLEKMLRRVAQADVPQEIRQYLRYSMTQPLIVALSESENPEDAALLEELNQADPAHAESFSQMILRQAEAYCAHNAAPGDGGEILAYLQENYRREDISLDEMASHFGVSREHMSRLFRAKTGMRYMDYITKLRMEAAWEMISTTDQSIADVFRAVGYIDRSSSTKKFKKYFGVTPAEARHQDAPE